MAKSKHGGNLKEVARAAGRPAEEILDFSANVNPLGPPDWLRPLVGATLSSIVHYPDPDCSDVVKAAAQRYGVAEDEILVGNGTTEILHLLPRALRAVRALIPVPAYVDYAAAAELSGLTVEKMPLREEEGFALDLRNLEARLSGDEMVFLGQPNNPTGLLFEADALRALASKHPSSTFLIDEAFGDFVEGMDSLTQRRPANVVVLLSLTKIYAIPGLRLGCVVADRDLTRRLRDIQPPWSVNTIAQAVGVKALHDADYLERTRAFVGRRRQELSSELQSLPGLTVYPGKANFVFVRIDRKDINAPRLAARLLGDGIAIRVCDNYDGLDTRFFRVAVRTEDENARLCESLRRALGASPKVTQKRKTPAIMFQGVSSNAGKSVMTAALCRILLQDGYRVAPFKSQNMSLNSFVTRDGGEMGRAQVVQAQACRIDPDVRMNPILLKPNSDTGSQVIVSGKPVGNMNVGEYIRYKPTAFDAAKAAFDSLAEEYDAIVLEGAGSPGEVNLKHHDIVNMNMARYADAPVLLVGDIDRGGVFASFVGTMEVLAEWERALVAGFVINRFRGKEELLGDALDYTLRHTGRPVLGVVPYFHDLGLPEEDSVSFKGGAFDDSSPQGEAVEIAVVDLPHISNFTDFDSLRMEPDVRLRIARTPRDLNRPDAVILPGSKNVIGDLAYLREKGLDRRILELAADGTAELVGVCGGFQMMGARIEDPHRIESAESTTNGLGLLPVSTRLAREKTLTRVNATHLASGLRVTGYEIHHGLTDREGAVPAIRRDDGETIGVASQDGRLWGTYVHGVFDADEFRRWFIDRLRVRRGLAPLGKVCTTYDLEPAFERLADAVRKRIDMKTIYRLMGLA
ncbi:MAG: cobyric acid synthase [Planctomycetota bacterium]